MRAHLGFPPPILFHFKEERKPLVAMAGKEGHLLEVLKFRNTETTKSIYILLVRRFATECRRFRRGPPHMYGGDLLSPSPFLCVFPRSRSKSDETAAAAAARAEEEEEEEEPFWRRDSSFFRGARAAIRPPPPAAERAAEKPSKHVVHCTTWSVNIVERGEGLRCFLSFGELGAAACGGGDFE